VFSRSTHITLLERLGGGDPSPHGEGVDHDAWRAFHERYGDLIRGFARLRGVQPADCDDLVQDVMVSLSKVMRSGFVYDPGKGTFRSYLKTTVVHAIARRARQNRPAMGLEACEPPATRASAGGSDDGDDAWEQQWRQHHTRLAMKTIEAEFNATDLEAFQRYALLQHDAAAVARDLRVSVDSVYQAKSRILRRLSKVIAQQVSEEG